MTRRIIKLAVVYLLLGLVVTWTMAWGTAMRWTLHATHSSFGIQPDVFIEPGPPPVFLFQREECPGGTLILLLARADSREEIEEIVDFHSYPPASVPPSIPGDWYHYKARSSIPLGIEARGWPWRALRAELIGGLSPTAPIEGDREYRGAVVFGPRTANGQISFSRRTTLPYLPQWPGLLADALLYAVLAAVVNHLIGWVRQTWRRKRGGCPMCGYDLAGLDAGACPECGRRRRVPPLGRVQDRVPFHRSAEARWAQDTLACQDGMLAEGFRRSADA